VPNAKTRPMYILAILDTLEELFVRIPNFFRKYYFGAAHCDRTSRLKDNCSTRIRANET
jgi:hypothetical protein